MKKGNDVCKAGLIFHFFIMFEIWRHIGCRAIKTSMLGTCPITVECAKYRKVDVALFSWHLSNKNLMIQGYDITKHQQDLISLLNHRTEIRMKSIHVTLIVLRVDKGRNHTTNKKLLFFNHISERTICELFKGVLVSVWLKQN